MNVNPKNPVFQDFACFAKAAKQIANWNSYNSRDQ